jgi:sucrose synthase
MFELFQTSLQPEEKTDLQQLVEHLGATDRRYFLRNEILQAFADYCQLSHKPSHFFHTSYVGQLIHYTHEMILENDHVWFVLRPKIADQEFWRISKDFSSWKQMTPQAFLDASDRLVNQYQSHILEIDLEPFSETAMRISDGRNIGQGLSSLNNYLCSQMWTNPQYWLDVIYKALHSLQYDNIQLLINQRIASGIQLKQQIKLALQLVSEQPPQQPYIKLHTQLQQLGFEPGWGNTSGRVRETLELLEQLFETPQPRILEAFVSRICTVFRVVLISIHGWIGQESVLGRDETFGQAIYVLEQARSLENRLQAATKLAGLDFFGIKPQIIILTRLIPHCAGTFCDLRWEKIDGTENAGILRVPFQGFNPEITDNWISKFQIWPYLEKFAEDAEKELLAKFQSKPNLIIGNYSDGNLVAFLLSRRLKVTQCNIAHSLEKPKYLFSSLHWQELEKQYNFSAQFTADLISMNAADFIITSTYQEIIGTPDSIGQYESYKYFTMPQLYHVVNGVDLFSPKFNRVPPGVNEDLFFPYYLKAKRDPQQSQRILDLLFYAENSQIQGFLEEPQKIPIFTVNVISLIKNIAGLIEFFGQSPELQKQCNLILLTSKLHPEEANCAEEIREMQEIRNLVNHYHLHGKIRWLGMRLPLSDMGEVYRIIADKQGVYVYFARFEAFGRSILEAMISGLPTFATQFGGAAEILEGLEDRFLINPTDFTESAQKIGDYLDKCQQNPENWREVSEFVIERIHHQYNWNIHTDKLLLLAKLFSFWNFIHPENNEARDRYVEALFYLIYQPRSQKILAEQQNCPHP